MLSLISVIISANVMIKNMAQYAESETQPPTAQDYALNAMLAPLSAIVETYEWVSLGEYTLTAYCPCARCCGIWSAQHPSRRGTNFVQRSASGTIHKEGRTIAVNPAVIPYGSEVKINGHIYIAEDTGGVPRRSKVIDIFFDCHQDALNFGRQSAEVWVKVYLDK